MNNYEAILSESTQNQLLIGGAKGNAAFGSTKIGNLTQSYVAKQGTSYSTQNLV